MGVNTILKRITSLQQHRGDICEKILHLVPMILIIGFKRDTSRLGETFVLGTHNIFVCKRGNKSYLGLFY